ncbi:hypothetical protein [Companilactobacillus sp. HBUAS56275]|uniref:Uncharacterized protein n=1 Tax=Candidatus Companilactobacillus pullicola TaxID=2838523 RepID=A0A9D2CMV7_9LACO|nr:hypothetical protein [Candidatus Companilactobacillus pullicola]
MKITIGNQNKNDDQLTEAIINAKDGDIIELLPGTYFSKDDPFICTIRRNITFIGKTNNKSDVELYCSFTVGAKNILIFKNLTISYPANDENTLSAYDGAEVYGDNVIINRQTSDDWDTIYGQNSFFSFKNSEILTGKKTKAIGLSLENCQLFMDKTKIQLLFQKNSQVYLKDSIILHKLELRKNSHLNFRNLTIDSTKINSKNDLAVKSKSEISGQKITFIKNDPQIRILGSHFDIKDFHPQTDKINFKFDEDSKIVVDGKLLSKQKPSN